MQCPRCAAEVSVLREFCPQCGAPLHSDSADRTAGVTNTRSPGDLKRRKRAVIGVAAVLLGIGVVSNGNWFDYDSHSERRPSRSHESEPRGAVTITAQQLYQEFRDDEDAAERKFDDREIVVTGEFLRIVPDGFGSLDLRLKTSDPEVPVGVDVAKLSIDDAKKLLPGQQVTVSCQQMGGNDETLWVRECAIQPVKDAVPPTPASDASADGAGNGA